MMGPGLMGKDAETDSDPEDSYLEDAFAALKDDDVDAFKQAMNGWMDACMDYEPAPASKDEA